MTISRVMNDLAKIHKEKLIDKNDNYVVYNNMIFKDGFDLEYYLTDYVNNNGGLGRNWFISEYESSEEISGRDILDNINDYEIMW